MSRELVSLQELRLLSELATAKKCLSPTDLAESCGMSRPSVYVLLRRLYDRSLVKTKPAPTPSTPQAVVYCITPKGKRMRENYAAAVGLQA